MHMLLFDGRARVVWHSPDEFLDEALAADDETPWTWADNPEEVLGALLTALVGPANQPAEATILVSGRRYRATFHPVDALPICGMAVLYPLSECADELSQRELEVLVNFANGMSAREVAKAMRLSVSTVDTHRASVYAKVGCDTVAGLTRFAVATGLVPRRVAARRTAQAKGPSQGRANGRAKRPRHGWDWTARGQRRSVAAGRMTAVVPCTGVEEIMAAGFVQEFFARVGGSVKPADATPDVPGNRLPLTLVPTVGNPRLRLRREGRGCGRLAQGFALFFLAPLT